MITLCTLFNSNYIDKAFTMYESIERHTKNYVLYALAMDDKCFDVLTDMSLPRFIPIRLSDFENDKLLEVKKERTIGEYCWTCSASLVNYVMEKFQPEYCAYIDSDLYFYDDVNCVVEEMKLRNASVMITGHRFDKYDEKQMIWRVGRYCVEFNTFKNDVDGRKLLDIWRNQCLEYCRCDGDGIHWADQKYLDNWPIDYSFAVETDNLGAGIAPWNLAQYRMVSRDEYGPVKVNCRGRQYRPFFYHFQGMTFEENGIAHTHTMTRWGVSRELRDAFYKPYLSQLFRNKKKLCEKYGIHVIIKHHPGVKQMERENITLRLLHMMRIIFIPSKFKEIILHTLPSAFYKKNDSVCI